MIIAAGPWSAALARLAGLDLPIVPVLHEYFVTEPVPGWHADLPCLRIPEVQVYARGESDRVLCGGFENARHQHRPARGERGVRGCAARPDWDVLGGFAGSLSAFAPAVAERGRRDDVPGLARVQPGRPVRRRPGQRDPRPGAWRRPATRTACPGRPGLAMHLVESLTGDPSPYVRSLSPDRFIPRTWSWEDARRDAQAVYETYYPMPAVTP